ncbi:MAG TPA: M20 family peptidase [Caulobacteraceae bacterium]|jgi:carboxypeptidase PM20D1|nr:M20 family peptidase [Caulobacteraceae bacterium]
MPRRAKIILGGAGLLVILGVVVALRTATYQPPVSPDLKQVKLAPAPAIDLDKVAQHLGEAVRIQTVSHQDPSQNDPAQWSALHDWLDKTYPAARAAMTREIVLQNTLLYTWKGSDPTLPPIILMAHQDVVPVDAATAGAWKHPPFSGEIADGAVWGRGSVDDKGSLISLFEAVDALAAHGFKPRRTVMILSGQDEETRGLGAQAAAALLQQRGVKALFVLDEGSAILTDNPLTGKPSILIGVAEKGYATLRVTATAPGGHSSMPPPTTAVGNLAQALIAITGHPFPMKFEGPGADMMRWLAPHASPSVKMAVANAWLFNPLLVSEVSKTPPGAAMLHTTIAPTMLSGSPKENVLPQTAFALINYRIMPSDSAAIVMARAKKAVRGVPVTLAWDSPPREPSAVSSTTSEGWKYVAAAAQASDPGVPLAPSLVVAGTDSGRMGKVGTDVYRLQPLEMSLADTKMIHGTNEHMTLANLKRMVDYYAVLIATAAR